MEKFFKKIQKKCWHLCIYMVNYMSRWKTAASKKRGSIAQLGEHLPYKQRVTGSSPVVPTIFGPVVQLVRTLACHARGRRFEPVPGRHFCLCSSVGRAEDWKSSCHWFDSDRRHQICGCSSSGRAPPCQGGGSEFEPRHPLHRGHEIMCPLFTK